MGTFTSIRHDGQTFTATPGTGTGKIPAIENPGGLLLWKASASGAAAATLRFEIDYVCRS